MKGLIIFFILLAPLLTNTGPILELPITIAANERLLTSYSLSTSQVIAQIDINSNQLSVCCQIQETLFQKIYYFMLNPFHLNQNFICRPKSILTHDVATFPKLGPLTVKINQTLYPKCQQGSIGLGKNSYFLSILPNTTQTFEVKRTNTKQNGLKYEVAVGGSVSSQFQNFPPVNSSLWMLTIPNIVFNNHAAGTQNVSITSGTYQLGIPQSAYLMVRHQLLTNFLCIEQQNKIYCPCTSGISSSYPPFIFQTGNGSYQIKPTAYLIQKDEICLAKIAAIQESYWQVHLLMMDDVNLLFNFGTGSVGIVQRSKSITASSSITQPLQIILNSVVILLMCLFVAMVLIEVIKHLTGLENASNESFENYMMKRAED